MAVSTQCPICKTVHVLSNAEVLHLDGAMSFWCRSSRTIALVETGPPRHPESPPPGPPLGIDDLIDMHALLADERWCTELTSERRP
jgi:hypothetical protein